MSRFRGTVGLVCLLAVCSPAWAGETSPSDDVAALAAQIDRIIESACAAKHVVPAPVAEDAEFLRRISLDVIGRIPRVADVHRFLEDPSPNKRRTVMEDLLRSPHYVTHFANVWRALLLPQNNNDQVRFLTGEIEGWLR